MLSFDTFSYFVDLFALAVIVVPLFYILPWAWARKLVLTLTGAYLLLTIAPRLALFYVFFWLVIHVLALIVDKTAESKAATPTLTFSILATLAALLTWRFFETAFVVNFNLELNDALQFFSLRVFEVDLASRIITPLGLSFATFRAIDYLTQINLGSTERGSLNHTMFLGFFPPVQIIGPVAGANELALRTERGPNRDDFTDALFLITSGLVKVFALAYPIRQSAEVFGFFESNGTLAVWGELFLYGWFFYLNFAGYSDIAIGSGRLFGIRLKPNFNNPYLKTNPQDFWNAWHMSLTRFAQKYVFVPMGGMRSGRQYIAVFATIMVIALWHDISWALFIFGLYHAAGLVAHRLLLKRREPSDSQILTRVVKPAMLFTFVLVSLPLLTLRLDELGSFYGKLAGMS